MNALREWWAKLARALDLRRGLDQDLSDEVRAHLDFLAQENIERGMTPDEARAAARRRFGNVTRVQDNARETWQFPRLETILQDVRYALRGIRKAPSFSLVVILTLALGIGANTAIFSVVYSVLLRALPYPNSERLVWLGEATSKAPGISITWINFQHWLHENDSFETMAGFANDDLTLTGQGDAVLTHSGLVTSSFFQLTGAKPALGRLFTDADDRPGAPPTAVVTADFWQRQLGGDARAIGQSLVLDGKAYEVIGVLPPGLRFFGSPVDFYLPIGRTAITAQKRSGHGSMRALGLLKPGATLTQARANLDAIMERLALSDPGPEDDHRSFAIYLTEASRAQIRPTLLILMSAVGLVLIIACVNVASLLLVRGTARTREVAVRVAVGAGRARLARQLLTENLVVAAMGGGLGMLLAAWCLRTLVLLGPHDIPRLSDARLDLPVLIFAAAITILVGLFAGLAPVFTAGKVDLTVALKEGSLTAGTGRRGQAFRDVLVIAEIAITLILAFASGLLIRSLVAAATTDPGFDARHLLNIELQLPESRYKAEDSVRQYYSQLAESLRAEPGVEDVGLVNCPPGGGDCGDYWFSILEKPPVSRDDVPLSLFNTVDDAYFRTANVRLIAGRVFNTTDRPGGAPVTIINEQLAHQLWAKPELALGQHLKVGGPYAEGPTLEIVGVVGNVSQMGLDADPAPTFYYPFSQKPDSAMVVTVRTNGEPAQWMSAARRQVSAMDRNVPIQSLRTAEDWLGATLERRRFATLLLGLFGALAMILAAVGIYGVLNYWVSARQREIAIRLAMGAQHAAILRWASAHAVRLVGIGMVLGGIGAWSASRWLESLVFGVNPHSPMMMMLACGAVLVLAGLAAGVPLWRAVHTDAVRNLHQA